MRDFSKSLKVGNAGWSVQTMPFDYPDNYSVWIISGGWRVEKDGKVIGTAKSATEVGEIIKKSGGTIKRK